MTDVQNVNFCQRIPPQSIEAEQAVLGSMFIDENCIGEVIEVIDESCFYKEEHKTIFKVILELFNKKRSIDLLTITEELKKKGVLEEIGGISYLTFLSETVPTSANAKYYAKIVKEKYIVRSLIQTATKIVQRCYEYSQDVDELLDKVEKMIFEICEKRVESTSSHIKEIVRENIELIDKLYQRKSHVTGIPTGFIDFDIKTAGLQPGDFIVVAGRPSMGKSSFILNIAEYVGCQENLPVVIFSLEMSKHQLVQRLLCSLAGVDAHKLRIGNLNPQDWPRITQAASKLSEVPIFVDDSPALNIFELRAKARRLKANYDIKLIIVDYLQLIRSAQRAESRQQEISEISRGLKALAKELNIPVIAVSQLSRQVEQRQGHKPQLSDLRESGAIEQDADLVALLFREEYYSPIPENKGIAEVIIAKQRNGPTGSVFLGFVKEYMKFINLAKIE